MTYPAVHLDMVDSTNTEALRRVHAGDLGTGAGPFWLVAREQTAGRGRSGRSWTSAPGNFYGSLVLPVDAPREVVGQVSLISGVAVIEALHTLAGGPIPGLRLKWPNDVLLGAGKLAGILCESTTRNDRLILICGIGINLANPPTDLGRPVAALAGIDPAALVAPLSHSHDRLLRLWRAGENFGAIRGLWEAQAGKRGEAVTVNMSTGPVAGTYQGLDADGAMLMADGGGPDGGGLRRITFGDVTLGTSGPARADIT